MFLCSFNLTFFSLTLGPMCHDPTGKSVAEGQMNALKFDVKIADYKKNDVSMFYNVFHSGRSKSSEHITVGYATSERSCMPIYRR